MTDDGMLFPGERPRAATGIPPGGRTVAAVDLGSNSFHMLVARAEEGRIHVVDRLRDRVQFGAGLDGKQRIKRKAAQAALDALGRFGQRLRDVPSDAIRAVGTNTFRRARNAEEFLREAHEALGHPIEIISGREEARLVYQGVAHAQVQAPATRRLVIDIGGGSTECIVGEGLDVLESDSLHMGCVTYTMRFFPDGEITRSRLAEARTAAGVELHGIRRRYRTLGWDVAMGSSGTINAIEHLLRAGDNAASGITPKGLKGLRKDLRSAGHVTKLALPGLSPERASVLAGGVAVLSAAFDQFGIEEMHASPAALREGLLWDLIGRIQCDDLRDHTVRHFQRRFQVDLEQAARIERVALGLLDQVAEQWDLGDPDARKLLSWAARVHELGLSLARSGYHKHGAYLLRHADMPGFSQSDQENVAALVESHRQKVRVAPESSPRLMRLCVLLRVACRLNRSRTDRAPITIEAEGNPKGLTLSFPPDWLDGNPLTWADLADEATRLHDAGIALVCR
jgi:exopolyphosphatase / guanosine-5'-triphosphate,3'-diphosphate pyrophosphatase